MPAAGWAVEDRDTTGVLLTRAGARMVVRWVAGAPRADPQQDMSALAAAPSRPSRRARSFGGVREFTTPSGDQGYLAPFAAPGSTGAIALVRSTQGEATVQVLAPSTTFASLSDELLGMITGIRLVRAGRRERRRRAPPPAARPVRAPSLLPEWYATRQPLLLAVLVLAHRLRAAVEPGAAAPRAGRAPVRGVTLLVWGLYALPLLAAILAVDYFEREPAWLSPSPPSGAAWSRPASRSRPTRPSSRS